MFVSVGVFDNFSANQTAWGSRPPSQSRPRSIQENVRPPTRSGSRPSSANVPSHTPTPGKITSQEDHITVIQGLILSFICKV